MGGSTQRKCLAASAAIHVGLLVVLLVAPAFLSRKPETRPPGANLVSAAAVEAVLSGHSAPAPARPPPAPQPPQPEPPVPVQPQPEPPKVVRQPDPAPVPKPVVPKPEPVPEVQRPTPPPAKAVEPKTVAKATEPKPAPKPPKKYELTRVDPKRTTPRPAAKSGPTLQDNINNILKDIGKPGKKLDIRTPGTSGGPAGDQYALLVRETYDKAWTDPSEVADTGAEVEVQVTIARSGKVLSAKVLSRSGISALDASVQRAVDRVRSIPAPMPPSTSDSQRVYIISFNLRDRR